MDTEVNDLIANSPNWILRSGISVLFIIVAILLSLSFIIKYPDITTSEGIITSMSPPIELKANTSGIIASVFVKDGQEIAEGDIVLMIENQCNLADLERLSDSIGRWNHFKTPLEFRGILVPPDLSLGDIQNSYAEMQSLVTEFNYRVTESAHSKNIEKLKLQLFQLDRLFNVMEQQKEIAFKELLLAKKETERNRGLYRESVISEADLSKYEKELLMSEKQLIAIENGIIENRIRKEQISNEIQRLKIQEFEFMNDSYLKIKESIKKLKQEIAFWRQEYLIIARMRGTVDLSPNVTDNYKLNADQVVASILPDKAENCKKFVRASAGESGIARVKIGDKVIVKVDGYPYKEYGVLISSVSSISSVPTTGRHGLEHEIIIPLPDTIRTNYNIEIPNAANRGVKAEIITKDRSIIERIFNEFKNLFKNV